MSDLDIAAQIREIKEEIRIREHCYPKWTHEGRITKTRADHKLALMREVLRTLLALQPKPPEQIGLLDDHP